MTAMLRVLLFPLMLFQVWQVLASVYLSLLAAASFAYSPGTNRSVATRATRPHRFAVLVPAHNEELLLGRLLTSLSSMEYPPEDYDVIVVADNCTDATADIGRQAGATVFERFDLQLRGKGQALRWLLQRVEIAKYDAVVIVDADSAVSPNLLTVADEALHEGGRILQVYDGVYNREESPAAGLRALAFDLHNRVRPMGQEVLGVSVGLMGNGMIISTDILRSESWDSYGLAEDMEAHAKLVARGERVRYLDAAHVLAEMPTSFADSAGQNERWESGRIEVARRHSFRLVLQALSQRSWPKAATALHLTVPPQSVQLLLGVLILPIAWLAGPPLSMRMAVLTLIGQGGYLSLGLFRLGRSGARLRDLAHAPAYILWKALLYVRVLVGGGPQSWSRGHREGETKTS